MSSNSYTIEDSSIGHKGGRYISKTPLAAARKVATQLYKLIKSETSYKKFSGKSISFSIRRTTAGGNKKLYEYTAKQVKLAKPIEIEINGKKIVYKNKINVKKSKTSKTSKASKTSKTSKTSKASKTSKTSKASKASKASKTKRTSIVNMSGGCSNDTCSVST